MTLARSGRDTRSPSGTLKVGLLSLAHVHAAAYLSLLNTRTDIEVRATDPDDDSDGRRRCEVELTTGRLDFVASYDELFAWGPDAVIICAENSRHRELVELSARHGVPVLCEKPLATNVNDARAMIEACKAAGISLMTAYPVRFHPALRSIKARIASGEIGQIRSAVGINNSQAPIDTRPWFCDPHLAGGGAFMDHIVHLADVMDLLLRVAPVEVYAQSNRIIHQAVVEVETAGLVVVTYADGTVLTIDSSWSVPASYPTWGGLTLALEFDHGSVEFDSFSGRIDLYDDQVGRLEWIDYGAHLDALMLDEFLSNVRSGTPPQPDGGAGLRSLIVVQAAYESAATGQPVRLASLE
jgi:1,5-anhydro-D-fructose reductase (1,5-anhydro-D-mannitol-forming)